MENAPTLQDHRSYQETVCTNAFLVVSHLNPTLPLPAPFHSLNPMHTIYTNTYTQSTG
ncbi:hypothetical protein INR49_016728, partial [Caranx melampygus]